MASALVPRLLTPKKKEKLWIGLAIACDEFVTKQNRKDRKNGNKYSVDDPLLYDVLLSTYHDIERYKVYHQNDPHKDKSDAIKRAAYYTKWIVRFKPISMTRSHNYQPTPENEWAFVNERFAIRWAFANLSFEAGRKFPVPTKEVIFNFLYYLHYRSLSEDALIEMYQLLYDVGTGKKLYVNVIT